MGMTALFTLNSATLGAEGKVHQVVKDDTLWHISRTYLDDPWLWPAVWRQNPDIKNPHLIYPNQLLKLPDFSSFAVDCGSHQVVKGDTLWDISGTYLHDFFLWPVIWQKNPGIENPHLIYPGQLVKIPCLGREEAPNKPVAESAVPQKPDIPESAKPEETLQTDQALLETEADITAEIDENGIVLPVVFTQKEKKSAENATDDIKKIETLYDKGLGEIIKKPVFNGQIVGQDRGYSTGAHGDILLVDLPEAVIGKTYGVYRDLGAIRHPARFWKKMGNLIMDIGIVEIMPDPEGKQAAVVLTAFQEIRSGDFLGPVPEPVIMVLGEKTDIAPDLTGTVIAVHERRTVAAGNGAIIYIDAGRDKGLVPGARFYLQEDKDPETSSTEIMVLRVGETTAAALVTQASLHVISPGARFKAVKN